VLPVLDIGPWHISTYSLTLMLAFLVGGMYAFHRLQPLGLPPRLAGRAVLLGLAVGFALSFVAGKLQAVYPLLGHPEVVVPAWGNKSVIGGIIGVIGTTLVYCQIYRLPTGRFFDAVAPALPLGQAIGRLGCLAGGCCFGYPTASPLGMVLPDSDGVWAVRYPTQLMSALADLAMVFILLAVERYGGRRPARSRRGWPFDGVLILLYVALYGLKRFGMEFLRGTAELPLWGPLNLVQLLCLAAVLVASGLMLWRLRRPSFTEMTWGLHSELWSDPDTWPEKERDSWE
jgi:phosphatidylglycerol:prolipoprotein diacylglycerol transferase